MFLRVVALSLAMLPAVASAQSGGNAEWSHSVTKQLPEEEEAEKLNNDDILQFVLADIPSDIIMAKIRSTEPDFDISTDGLINLNSASVPKPIVAAMISRQRTAQRSGPMTEQGKAVARRGAIVRTLSNDDPDPMVPHLPGMYLLNPTGHIGKMKRVEPVEAELEGGGGIMGVATLGMMDGTRRAKIRGANALIQTRHSSPVFFVYFDESVPDHLRSHSPTIWSAGAGAQLGTPQDLELVQFEERKGRREARVGEKMKEKHKIQFTTELLSPGIYRVTVRSMLRAGEYGWVQSLQANDGKSRDAARIFDFEVQK